MLIEKRRYELRKGQVFLCGMCMGDVVDVMVDLIDEDDDGSTEDFVIDGEVCHVDNSIAVCVDCAERARLGELEASDAVQIRPAPGGSYGTH